jgi:hypothetical protein
MPYSHNTRSGLPILTSKDRYEADHTKQNRHRNFTTLICNASTGQSEIIRGNWSKFAHVAKPRYKPFQKKDADRQAWRATFGTTQYGQEWWPAHVDPAKHLERFGEAEERLAQMDKLGWLHKEKERIEMLIERTEEKKLCNQIHSLLLTQRISAPSTPLAKCITPCIKA